MLIELAVFQLTGRTPRSAASTGPESRRTPAARARKAREWVCCERFHAAGRSEGMPGAEARFGREGRGADLNKVEREAGGAAGAVAGGSAALTEGWCAR